MYEIRDYDVNTVKCMLDFIYTGHYKSNEERNTSDAPGISGSRASQPGSTRVEAQKDITIQSKILAHLQINAVGCQYQIPGLCALSLSNITKLLADYWDAEWFCIFIRKCYDLSDDEELHNFIAETAGKHVDELLDREDFDELDAPAAFYRKMLRTSVETTKSIERGIALKQKVRHEATEKAIQNEVDKMRSRLSKLEDLNSTLSAITKVVGVQKKCRSCGQRKGFRIGDTDRGFTAVCGNCGAEHPNTDYLNHIYLPRQSAMALRW